MVNRRTILRHCAIAWGVSMNDLMAKGREHNKCMARHVYCYVAKNEGYTLSQIGSMINRDHSTVLNSKRVAEELLETSEIFRETYLIVLDHLQGNKREKKARKELSHKWTAQEWVSHWLYTGNVSVGAMCQNLMIKCVEAYIKEGEEV